MTAAAKMVGERGAKCCVFYENIGGLPDLHEPIRDATEVYVILPSAPDFCDEEFFIDFVRYYAGGIIGRNGRLLREIPTHDAIENKFWPICDYAESRCP